MITRLKCVECRMIKVNVNKQPLVSLNVALCCTKVEARSDKRPQKKIKVKEFECDEGGGGAVMVKNARHRRTIPSSRGLCRCPQGADASSLSQAHTPVKSPVSAVNQGRHTKDNFSIIGGPSYITRSAFK
ncbi:hypothetical protein J6590_047018 [Homalodisca vitripennis]|nr:hypothetical protein J6590_047018 [Homalodisca vitripennis]